MINTEIAINAGRSLDVKVEVENIVLNETPDCWRKACGEDPQTKAKNKQAGGRSVYLANYINDFPVTNARWRQGGSSLLVHVDAVQSKKRLSLHDLSSRFVCVNFKGVTFTAGYGIRQMSGLSTRGVGNWLDNPIT
jgi:hypothetical protein